MTSRPLSFLVLTLSACSPILAQTPAGWRVPGDRYLIKPDDKGAIVTGWKIANYEKTDRGLERIRVDDPLDLSLEHAGDDGVADLVTLKDGVVGKNLETLAARLVESMRLVEVKTETQVGFRTVEAVTQVPYDVVEIEAGRFDAAGGAEGYEVVLESRHVGLSEAERRAYVAWVRPKNGVVAVRLFYRNAAKLFGTGLSDMKSLARRIEFVKGPRS